MEPEPLKLTPREVKELLSCSVERMINTSIRIADIVAQEVPNADEGPIEELKSLADTSGQDWQEYKLLVCKLWAWASNEERKKLYRAEIAQKEAKP